MASPALVVGMQDNEYTDAQVGDAGGLFKSLDPAPCRAVPAYLIQCSSSSLPDPVPPIPAYLIQCSSSSLPDPVPPIPVYLIQCCSSSLPHPVLWFHAVCLIHCSGSILPHPVFQFQSTSSSTPVQKTLISLVVYFCFCTIFFFQISLYCYNFFSHYYFAIFHILLYTICLNYYIIYTIIVLKNKYY